MIKGIDTSIKEMVVQSVEGKIVEVPAIVIGKDLLLDFQNLVEGIYFIKIRGNRTMKIIKN